VATCPGRQGKIWRPVGYVHTSKQALLDYTERKPPLTAWCGASKANLRLLDRRGLTSKFQRAKPRGKPMPTHIRCGNATRAKVRSRVEHVFAAEKRRLHLVIRTIGLVRASAKIALANLVYNFNRFAWLEERAGQRRAEPHNTAQSDRSCSNPGPSGPGYTPPPQIPVCPRALGST
jgi:hypothetical protein